jgi:hypothetical protein
MAVFVNQHFSQALALLIKKFGQRIDGGYEIYIPDHVLAAVSPYWQIQEVRHPEKARLLHSLLSQQHD